MQRLTILFIGLTLLAISLIGTVLGVKYSMRHTDSGDMQASVLMQEADPLKVNEFVSTKETGETKPEENNDEETQELHYIPAVTAQLANKAGFQDVKLQTLLFDGFIFKDIDISAYRDDEHATHNILEDNEHAGLVNELYFPSAEITNEVYALIKAVIESDEAYTINETNQYGHHSFFANSSADTNNVFLVVKLDKRLYTFHYPAKNHNKMKNLINLL